MFVWIVCTVLRTRNYLIKGGNGPVISFPVLSCFSVLQGAITSAEQSNQVPTQVKVNYPANHPVCTALLLLWNIESYTTAARITQRKLQTFDCTANCGQGEIHNKHTKFAPTYKTLS